MSTCIYNSIVVECDVESVFDYATTPAHWPEWHPSSLKIYGDAAHSLNRDETFEEDVRAGGRNGHLVWKIVERQASRLWVAEAQVDNGASLTLMYKVSSDDKGSLFERTLNYELPNFFLRLLNKLILQRRIERESTESLVRLKSVLEQ